MTSIDRTKTPFGKQLLAILSDIPPSDLMRKIVWGRLTVLFQDGKIVHWEKTHGSKPRGH